MTAEELLQELLKIPEEKRKQTTIDKWDDYRECAQPIDSFYPDEDYADTYILG